MSKSYLDDKSKKAVFITLFIGFISNFIIESGVDIAILCFFIYIVKKYISTTNNIEEYKEYQFRDKEKFEKGKNLFAWILYIYSVVRIVTLIIYPAYRTVMAELFLLILIYGLYENYLTKKYVIKKVKNKKKLKLY